MVWDSTYEITGWLCGSDIEVFIDSGGIGVDYLGPAEIGKLFCDRYRDLGLPRSRRAEYYDNLFYYVGFQFVLLNRLFISSVEMTNIVGLP